jgi:hypothetical protein
MRKWKQKQNCDKTESKNKIRSKQKSQNENESDRNRNKEEWICGFENMIQNEKLTSNLQRKKVSESKLNQEQRNWHRIKIEICNGRKIEKKILFSREKRTRKKMNEKINWGMRKLDFLGWNAAENVLQGGYQICSDTMLWNMASMEEMREKL